MENKLEGSTKVVDDKQIITYKKLVVPMSMRSVYWKYFGFPATERGDILTKVKIVCILCKIQIAYNHNTSNLRVHLQKKHPNEFLELEASMPVRRPKVESAVKPHMGQRIKLVSVNDDPSIFASESSESVQIKGEMHYIAEPTVDIQTIYDPESDQNMQVILKRQHSDDNSQNVTIILPEENSTAQMQEVSGSKNILDAITEFVVMDMQLPDIVEGNGFQRLIATLFSPCEIPSKAKLEEELIPKMYEVVKQSVQTAISKHSGPIGLTVEEWYLANDECYITVSVLYQPTSEPEIETKVLTTFHCSPDCDSSQLEMIFEGLLTEWGIKENNITAAIVASSREDISSVLLNKGIVVVPCLVHSIQTCIAICLELPEIAAVVNKCRTLVSLISNYSGAITTLKIEEQLVQMEGIDIKMDYPAVWTSTYGMLEQLARHKSYIPSVLDAIEYFNKDSCMLTEYEWGLLDDLITVLEPFKVTIMTLSDERNPLMSLLKPLLWQLANSHLKVVESDSKTATNFKLLLSENLLARYQDSNIETLLQTATMLDPRFKTLPWTREEEKEAILENIKEVLLSYVDKRSECATEASPSKKLKVTGMEALLSNLCGIKSDISPEERVNLEVAQYQSEPSVVLDDCPLHWWANAAVKCPHLARLATKYNCITATASPSHRIAVEKQVQYDMKRRSLSAELVDILVFLNANHAAQ